LPNLRLKLRQINLDNLPRDVVLDGRIPVNDLIPEGDDVADKRDPLALQRKIAHELGKGLADYPEFALDRRTQQLVV
jgi:hypothetical protein